MTPLLALALVSNIAGATGTRHPARIVVIGIDGVSLNLLQPYSERGITPNLGRLIKSGARGHLESIWPLRTPQVWTSIATGKLPGQHGIWDHLSNTYFNPPYVMTKKRLRVTSKDRTSKAIWGLLDDAGMSTLTVGWMASWPAESLKHGVMVAPVELMHDPRQTTIKGSFWRDAEDLVTPKRLWPRVQRLIVEPRHLNDAEIAAFADVPPEGHRIYELPRIERYIYALRWSLARAQSIEAITVDLASETEPDVILSYFQCPDSLLHRFWIFSESEAEIRQRLATHGIPNDQAAELKKRFGGIVEACYRDIDARIGRILEATAGDDTLVMIVSDHGFGVAAKPHRLKGEPYSGDHLDQGVIIAVGPGVRRGAWIQGASVLDIAPVILHHLGLAVADDMRGKVPTDLFEPELLAKKPIKTIPTYETTPQLEVPYADGWPIRKVPLRPTAAQMPK